MNTEERAQTAHRAGLDRRRFLKLAGAGGAGAVGLGLIGADLLAGAGQAAAATDAISLGNRINQLVVAAHNNPNWNWAEKCQQAQYYAEWAARGTESGIQPYPSARAAYLASRIASTNPATAPAGSFSYWTYGSLGHVVTNIGNGYCINTSVRMQNNFVHDFGHGLRITRIADQPEPYLGWSYTNGSNGQIAMTPWSPSGGGGQNWAFNPPDTGTQKRIQQALFNRKRYSGPIDGAWGPNSIKGIQTTIKNVGYSGAVDGVPGYNTCHYVQVYAKKFGSYAGPVDAILGPNSWAGFALGLERP